MFLIFSSLLGNIEDEDGDEDDDADGNIGLRTVFVILSA